MTKEEKIIEDLKRIKEYEEIEQNCFILRNIIFPLLFIPLINKKKSKNTRRGRND